MISKTVYLHLLSSDFMEQRFCDVVCSPFSNIRIEHNRMFRFHIGIDDTPIWVDPHNTVWDTIGIYFRLIQIVQNDFVRYISRAVREIISIAHLVVSQCV